MAEYIDRQAVIEAAYQGLKKPSDDPAWIAILDRLTALPSADVEPVRPGRWLKNGSRYCECSVCHHEGNTSGVDNYCGFCGARMVGYDSN